MKFPFTAPLARRTFLAATAAGVASTASTSLADQDAPGPSRDYRFCAFIKFLQSLGPTELADALLQSGFDGAELTVRKGGYLEPEEAADRLPEVHQALRDRGVRIDIVTTDVVRPDQPHARAVLETAAQLGIPFYRMGFLRYDLARPVLSQLENWRAPFRELAALNRELGIAGVYQNHAGRNYLGGTFWDLQRLLEGIPQKELGCAFDVRHAMIEGGLSWPVYFNLIRPHLSLFSVKDYQWEGRRDRHVPLGEGRVDPAFFKMVREEFPAAQLTLHVEYLGGQGVEPNRAALERDLRTLKAWLA